MPILNTLLNGFRSAAGVGGPSRPTIAPAPRRPRLPAITANEAGENRRTVDAMLRTGDDGRVGRLLRTGITEESARELAQTLSPDAIDQFVQDWGSLVAEQRGMLVRVLTAISGKITEQQLKHGHRFWPEQLPAMEGPKG